MTTSRDGSMKITNRLCVPRYPGEFLAQFSSFVQWRDFFLANPHIHDKQYIEAQAQRIAKGGFFCPYHGRRVLGKEIILGAPNYREGLVHGGLNSRLRAVWLELVRFLGHSCTKKIHIYAPEALTGFADLLRERFPRFTGSEYFPDGVKGANWQRVRHEDMLALSFADNAFDVAIVNDIFEHVPDIDRCLVELARVVRPGGRLITTFPFNSNSQDSVIKARLTENGVEHLTEPEYHGNPVDPKGSLVFEIPGWNILNRTQAAGWSRAQIVYETSTKHGVLGGGSLGIFTMVAER